MAIIREFKCGNCGYHKTTTSGSVYGRGNCIVLGCLKCKEMINPCSDMKTEHMKEITEKKDKNGAPHFFCPEDSEELIWYGSEEYKKMKGDKKLDLCPKCGKWEMKKIPNFIRI
jgi:ribosomal protein S27AE